MNTNGGNAVEGCFIGTDITGTSDFGNSSGVYISDITNNRIGGTEPAQANLLSGNSYGLFIGYSDDANNNLVQGNLIGTDITGTLRLGNSYGIRIMYAENNLIGGTEPGAGNLISGNSSNGIDINVDYPEGI